MTSNSEPLGRDKSEVTRGALANQTAYNVSKLLDSLLQDYDNSLRPDFAGKWVNFDNHEFELEL